MWWCYDSHEKIWQKLQENCETCFTTTALGMAYIKQWDNECLLRNSSIPWNTEAGNNQYHSYLKHHVNTQPWGTSIVPPQCPHSTTHDMMTLKSWYKWGRGKIHDRVCYAISITVLCPNVTIFYLSLQKSVLVCLGVVVWLMYTLSILQNVYKKWSDIVWGDS